MQTIPRFFLLSESSQSREPGRWRFVLRDEDGSQRLVADDLEPSVRGERLELLTVVRGLEALQQRCRVTVMTHSAYVREGIRHGISAWRQSDWRWERFGEMAPISNADLWKRVERAMRYHQVECRTWRFDPPHQALTAAPTTPDRSARGVESVATATRAPWFTRRQARRLLVRYGWLAALAMEGWRGLRRRVSETVASTRLLWARISRKLVG